MYFKFDFRYKIDVKINFNSYSTKIQNIFFLILFFNKQLFT